MFPHGCSLGERGQKQLACGQPSCLEILNSMLGCCWDEGEQGDPLRVMRAETERAERTEWKIPPNFEEPVISCSDTSRELRAGDGAASWKLDPKP